VPIQIDEASALTAATRSRIRPPRKLMTCITSGTPWPLASIAQKAISGPLIKPPNTGTMTTKASPNLLNNWDRAWLKEKFVIHSMVWIKTISSHRLFDLSESPLYCSLIQLTLAKTYLNLTGTFLSITALNLSQRHTKWG
jgi:hypothetical protein